MDSNAVYQWRASYLERTHNGCVTDSGSLLLWLNKNNPCRQKSASQAKHIIRNYKEGLPKYWNSPGIGGSDLYWTDIRGTKVFVLVEGPWDAIAVREHLGYAGVATLGCKLSPGQSEAIQRHIGSRLLLVAYDNDKAGHRGRLSATTNLMKLGLLPTGYINWRRNDAESSLLSGAKYGIVPREVYLKGLSEEEKYRLADKTGHIEALRNWYG